MKNSIKLIKKITNKNNYKSANWNIEYATRYIVEVDKNIIEISFFKHYLNNKFIKNTIELPVSYGCPVKCKYCASGDISFFDKLDYKTIYSLYNYILEDNKLTTQKELLITFTGIGEGALNFENIKKATILIYQNNSNVKFTFSSVGINFNYFKLIDKLSEKIKTHYFQITYIHHSELKVFKIIPYLQNNKYSIHNLILAINDLVYIKPRINYIVINSFNDSMHDWEAFVKIFTPIKNKIRIRITSLNDTVVSKKNNLAGVSFDTLNSLNDFFKKNGYDSYVYHTNVNDNLNCGQLIWDYNNENNTCN